MLKLKYNFLLIFYLILINTGLTLAQREFGVNDSTFYFLNNDTVIIAAQKKLYIQTNSGTTLLYDFTNPNENYYIRDFDIISENIWYTLVGSRYIGFPTFLYKTSDSGTNWNEDTSFYSVTYYGPSSNNYYNSLNQVQKTGEDTVVLFVGYYESGIVYSTDAGLTWNPWFRNLLAHYQGLLKCNSDYYLWGYNGDGFSAWMFKFPSELLFSPDTNSVWNQFVNGGYHPRCSGIVNINCVYCISCQLRYSQYLFFKNYIDSICIKTTSVEYSTNNFKNFVLYPNPFSDFVTIDNREGKNLEIKIIDILGRVVLRKEYFDTNIKLNLSQLSNGVYIITINDKIKINIFKIVKN